MVKVMKKANIIFLLIIIFLMVIVSYIFYIKPFYMAKAELPEIYYGYEKCDWCGMVISHKKFSAAYYDEYEGRWKKFDDIGCMLHMLMMEDAEIIKIIYVVDYQSEELIKADHAYFVVVDPHAIWTPMSSGILAFKYKSSAQLFAEQYKGKIYTFEELLWAKS